MSELSEEDLEKMNGENVKSHWGKWYWFSGTKEKMAQYEEDGKVVDKDWVQYRENHRDING